MPKYRVTQDTPLFKAANLMSENLGIVKAGTEFQGSKVGGYIKTRIDSVATGDGFVSALVVSLLPTVPQPLPPERIGDFIALATKLAWDLKIDRDYLLALAYARSHNLNALGGADDVRIGPF